jgi:hypothetical protein
MKPVVLGTGDVGRSIATGLLDAGYDVTIAGRSAESEGAIAWLDGVPRPARGRADTADYASAAPLADIVFLCVRGSVALETAMTLADQLSGKTLVDVTNPLSFPDGKPMELLVANTDSQAEQIQRALPDTHVVKTLNIVNSEVMIKPAMLSGDHFMPIAGNDDRAKKTVSDILTRDFGWKRVVDLGDISAARGMESYLHYWLRLWSALGTAKFNLAIVTE